MTDSWALTNSSPPKDEGYRVERDQPWIQGWTLNVGWLKEDTMPKLGILALSMQTAPTGKDFGPHGSRADLRIRTALTALTLTGFPHLDDAYERFLPRWGGETQCNRCNHSM